MTTTFGLRAAMNNSDKGGSAPGGRAGTLSKGRPQGQANAGASVVAAAGMLGGAALALIAWATPATAADGLWRPTPSGLPVQVVAETREWRRICDPRGGLAWVHGRTIDGKRAVLGRTPPAAIRTRPKMQSRIVAYLRPDALAALDRCKDDWCKIKVERVSGWVPSRAVWGATEAAQCR